ncbi:unnamed protein product, partial [marine sediment metagenome]
CDENRYGVIVESLSVHQGRLMEPELDRENDNVEFVIPAKAGIQALINSVNIVIPAKAGTQALMNSVNLCYLSFVALCEVGIRV